MEQKIFTRRKKMLKLQEELLAVEKDRLIGHIGISPDELDSYLENIIDRAKDR